MTREQKQSFTRKVSQANRSQLVVIKFEILFAYIDDAKAAYQARDWENFKQAVRKVSMVLQSFEEALDFQYEISNNLYAIYDYHCRQLSKAILHRSVRELADCEEMLGLLYEAFKKVAQTDTSLPLMQNTQQVYAGYTYGKTDLNESCDSSASRGFFV